MEFRSIAMGNRQVLLRAKSETNSNSQATDSPVVSFRWSSISFFLSRVSPTFFFLPRVGLPRLDPLRETRAKQKRVCKPVIRDSGVTQMGKRRGGLRGEKGRDRSRGRKKTGQQTGRERAAISASSPTFARAPYMTRVSN